jgi:hypothetical protein
MAKITIFGILGFSTIVELTRTKIIKIMIKMIIYNNLQNSCGRDDENFFYIFGNLFLI